MAQVFPLQLMLKAHISQKKSHTHKNKIGTSRPPPPKSPPKKTRNFMGMELLLQKEQTIPGAHKIGAAISGPRIAGGRNCRHLVFLLNFYRDMGCPVQWSTATPSALGIQFRANLGSAVKKTPFTSADSRRQAICKCNCASASGQVIALCFFFWQAQSTRTAKFDPTSGSTTGSWEISTTTTQRARKENLQRQTLAPSTPTVDMKML